MVKQTIFQHVLDLDLQIKSTLGTLKEGIEFIKEANDDNSDPTLVKLLELHKKAIQSLEELNNEAAEYIT